MKVNQIQLPDINSQPAVNRQPGYRRGTRRAYLKKQFVTNQNRTDVSGIQTLKEEEESKWIKKTIQAKNAREQSGRASPAMLKPETCNIIVQSKLVWGTNASKFKQHKQNELLATPRNTTANRSKVRTNTHEHEQTCKWTASEHKTEMGVARSFHIPWLMHALDALEALEIYWCLGLTAPLGLSGALIHTYIYKVSNPFGAGRCTCTYQ